MSIFSSSNSKKGLVGDDWDCPRVSRQSIDAEIEKRRNKLEKSQEDVLLTNKYVSN